MLRIGEAHWHRARVGAGARAGPGTVRADRERLAGLRSPCRSSPTNLTGAPDSSITYGIGFAKVHATSLVSRFNLPPPRIYSWPRGHDLLPSRRS